MEKFLGGLFVKISTHFFALPNNSNNFPTTFSIHFFAHLSTTFYPFFFIPISQSIIIFLYKTIQKMSTILNKLDLFGSKSHALLDLRNINFIGQMRLNVGIGTKLQDLNAKQAASGLYIEWQQQNANMNLDNNGNGYIKSLSDIKTTFNFGQLYDESSPNPPTTDATHKYLVIEKVNNNQVSRISTGIGVTYTNGSVERMLFDLTDIFGVGSEPSTTDAAKGCIAEIRGLDSFPSHIPYEINTIIELHDKGLVIKKTEKNDARIKTISGKSIVWNQLVDDDTSSITLKTGHKYLTRIGGSSSIVDGNNNSISVAGGTDEVFDLTVIYGPGNEPNIATFESSFPETYYPYDGGTIKSFEGGSFISSTETADGDTIETLSTKPLDLFDVFDYEYDTSREYLKHDAVIRDDKMYIFNQDAPYTGSWNVSQWLCIRSGYSAYDSTKKYYKGNKCSRNGIVYICSTDIDTPEAWTAGHWIETDEPVNPGLTGLLGSNGLIADEIDDSGITFNIGCVDLGSVTIGYNGYNHEFYANLTSPDIYPAKIANNPNGVCTKYYVQGTLPTTDDHDMRGVLWSNGYFYFYDKNYSNTTDDIANLKRSLQGVLLYYQLAEPIRVEFSHTRDMGYKYTLSSGVEEVISESIPHISPKLSIFYDINGGTTVTDTFIKRKINELSAFAESTPKLLTSFDCPLYSGHSYLVRADIKAFTSNVGLGIGDTSTIRNSTHSGNGGWVSLYGVKVASSDQNGFRVIDNNINTNQPFFVRNFCAYDLTKLGLSDRNGFNQYFNEDIYPYSPSTFGIVGESNGVFDLYERNDNNNFPFIHLKCATPPTLLSGSTLGNIVIVPDDSFDMYRGTTGWMGLYSDDTIPYTSSMDNGTAAGVGAKYTTQAIELKTGSAIVVKTPNSSYPLYLYKCNDTAYTGATQVKANGTQTAYNNGCYPSGAVGSLMWFIEEDGYYFLTEYTTSTGTSGSVYNNRFEIKAPGYTSAKVWFDKSVAKHNVGIYDGAAVKALKNNTNSLWPESMRFWLGFGDISYDGQTMLEPEDNVPNTIPINQVVLTTLESGQGIPQEDVDNANTLMNYFKSKGYIIDLEADKLYGWQCAEPTSFTTATIPSTDAAKITDLTVLKHFTNQSFVSIPNSVFQYLTNLKKIAFPPQLVSIGSNANPSAFPIDVTIPNLSQFFKMTYYNANASFLRVAGSTLRGADGTPITSIIVPNDVVAINPYACYAFRELTDIDLHEDVMTIGASAFYNCIGLRNMRLHGNTKKTLGGSALTGTIATNATNSTDILYITVDNPRALFEYLASTDWQTIKDEQFLVDEYDETTTNLHIQGKTEDGTWIGDADNLISTSKFENTPGTTDHCFEDQSVFWVASNFSTLAESERNNVLWSHDISTENLYTNRSTLVNQISVPRNFGRIIELTAKTVSDADYAAVQAGTLDPDMATALDSVNRYFLLRGSITNRPNIDIHRTTSGWFHGAPGSMIDMEVSRIDDFDTNIMDWKADVLDSSGNPSSVLGASIRIHGKDVNNDRRCAMVNVDIGNSAGGCFDKRYHIFQAGDYPSIIFQKSNGQAFVPQSVGQANTYVMYSRIDDGTISGNTVTYNAAKYCYEYGQGEAWWLEDMCELGVMMTDDNFDPVRNAMLAIQSSQSQLPSANRLTINPITNSSYRWSALRYSGSYSWYFSSDGFSGNHSFSRSRVARPVSLFSPEN